MKRIACLVAASAALAVSPSAWACGPVQPRPYLRDSPPEQIGDNEIVAEVELDLDTPVSTWDQGIRFRVRRMIHGEPAVALVVPWENCSPETPGRLSGIIVARRVSRDGDDLVVYPVLPETGPYFSLPTPERTSR